MATNSIFSSRICEKECKEIHDKLESVGGLNDLGRTLVRRNRLERRQIRETYLAMYKEDLVNHLQKTQLSNQKNQICYLLSLWMLEPYERDSVIAKKAFEHGDTNYKALIEIYSGRKSSHLLLIKQAYQTKFKRQLDQDILNSETPHPYQRILVGLATSHKSHHAEVSQHVAKCDAKRLYETGEGRAGAIEEAVVLEIFSKRSIPQLRLTFSTYKHIYGHEYAKALKKQTSGGFEDALRTVVKCMYTPSNYYAKMLQASIQGTITDKTVLSRVLISRAETDLEEIKTVFKQKFGVELRKAICEKIKSDEDQREFFVALASTNNL